MACNFLQPRGPNTADFRGSDTLSEVSESGTATSGWTSGWDSREDLRDFVTKIGLKDVSDLHQDRFRVDRRKLELMLSGDSDAPMPADIFFEQIMSDTETFITWPTKLKIGAKSKKDPHVRIAGRPEDVIAAKERIMVVLDTRCNRVTMKMDVSYTDHSHIIGKGGLSIKRVMEETQCHVHFPDSNRSNPTEKSNQVSIAGDIQGVELARSRVRQKTPVVFGFELPIMAQSPEPDEPYVLQLQTNYNVQVMMRTRPKLHATLVLVKGAEWEVDRVKQATMLLVEYMCKSLANQIPVQMSMEISPHHHSMVIGKNHSNIKEIMRVAGAQIMFPDAQDPNIPTLKKSNITITGTVHSVYIARQLLIGSLPLLLMFDLPEDTTGLPTKVSQVSEIQQRFDVQINIRHKPKQNTMACVIKGFERAASNVYKARHAILAIESPYIMADIPSTYLMPSNSSTHSLLSNLPSPMSPPTWQYAPNLDVVNMPQRGNNSQQSMINPGVFGHQNSMQGNPGHFGQSNHGPLSPFMGNGQYNVHNYGQQFRTGQMGQTAGRLSYGNMVNHNMQPQQQSLTSSGYQSLTFSGNSISEPSRDNSTYSSISTSGSSHLSSPSRHNLTATSLNQHKNDFSSVMPEISPGYHGPTVDKASDPMSISPNNEFEQKRAVAYRMMYSRLDGSSNRHPTNTWSGYGMSHTNEKGRPAKLEDDTIWTSSTSSPSVGQNNLPPSQLTPTAGPAMMNTSNHMDHTPGSVLRRITGDRWPDLITLLNSLGLDKYIHLFQSHEIDLATFASITDRDLAEIGVTAFGARRKMLLAIAELNKRGHSFAAAPGAERKSSSSSSTLSNPCTPEKQSGNRLGW